MNPVLILGAGINGAALARELAINGVGVHVVDAADIASGTTAYSSRLIHGGLRYLEYGEFDLVRESLEERTRLLRLAPQFVQPLRLYIPVERRLGGLWRAFRRIIGWEKNPGSLHAAAEFDQSGHPADADRAAKYQPPPQSRGLWAIRLGLWLYDKYARGRTLPRHAVHRLNEPNLPPVRKDRYRWLCSFSDAAVHFPERFVVALLKDAEQEAARLGSAFQVWTYSEARLAGEEAEIRPVKNSPDSSRSSIQTNEEVRFRPSAIINATGAWVDETLERLEVPSKRLIGGTKGSHILTQHPGLCTALAGRGVYAEAPDGRPVFLLPLREFSLVGTTDIPFRGDPRNATASEEEIEYLLSATNKVMADVRVRRSDVAWHYSGVRPLPYTTGAIPGSITRRHFFVEHEGCPLPLFSIIGGKLTTCRSLAEEAADVLFERLGVDRTASSREREIPDPLAVAARPTNSSRSTRGTAEPAMLSGCDVADEVVRCVIRSQWVQTLDDLVSRRLMLLYAPSLSRESLARAAELMCEQGKLAAADVDREVQLLVEKLHRRHGIAFP